MAGPASPQQGARYQKPAKRKQQAERTDRKVKEKIVGGVLEHPAHLSLFIPVSVPATPPLRETLLAAARHASLERTATVALAVR